MPTIKKINLNGTSYDIGGGLTEDVKQGLLNFAEKAAYSDPDYGQEVYDELYDAFYDNTWSVTNTLSNASTSNPATKTAKDGTYTAIISANTGYTLDGATVSVTMGGANVTSAVYSNGTISIPAVTGDVVITVVAVALTVVSISAVYTQSGTVLDTDQIDSLKADLVVTATFNDSSTEVVPSTDYTLSGTLTRGTSTITVSYQNVTTTFTATVKNIFDTMTFNRDNWIMAAQSGKYLGWVWKASNGGAQASARAGANEIIPNNGYTFTVTDSSKYNLVAYNVTSDEAQYITTSGNSGYAYPGTNNSKSWAASGSSSSDYVALSFKKMNNTDFTDEELANMYGTVFTVSQN